MSVRDGRKAPFCWQSRHALAHLRREWPTSWEPGEKPVAVKLGLNVYFALTEIANEHRARTRVGVDSDGFEATKTEIRERACVDEKSIYLATAVLERIGLLEVTREIGHGNIYTLVEPDPVQRVPDPRGQGHRPGVRETGPRHSDPTPQGQGAEVTTYREEGRSTPQPPKGGQSRSRRRRRRGEPERPSEYRA